MNELRGAAPMNEAIVEPLLVDAILKLNRGQRHRRGRRAAARRARCAASTPTTRCSPSCATVCDYKPAPDEPTIDVTIIDSADPSRNSYVVDRGVRHPHRRQPRAAP